MSTVGFGILVGCAVLALAFGGATFAVLCLTARDEENFLRDRSGERYLSFAARVPAIIPDPRLFSTPQHVTCDVGHLRTSLRAALAFLGLLPLAELLDCQHEETLFCTDPDVVVNILRTIGKLFEEYWCNGVSSADIAKTFRYIR